MIDDDDDDDVGQRRFFIIVRIIYNSCIHYVYCIHTCNTYYYCILYYELGINKLSYAVSLLYHLYTPDARFFENKSL